MLRKHLQTDLTDDTTFLPARFLH